MNDPSQISGNDSFAEIDEVSIKTINLFLLFYSLFYLFTWITIAYNKFSS